MKRGRGSPIAAHARRCRRGRRSRPRFGFDIEGYGDAFMTLARSDGLVEQARRDFWSMVTFSRMHEPR